jgi:lysophospholipase L1-like esterase
MNICIFGDSITWGASDYEKSGWVERLKSYCMESCKDIAIYNLGISGDNTNNLLRRFKAEAETREPNLIIFAIGINDSLYIQTKGNHSVDLGRFKSNLSELVKIAQKITDNIMFVGITRVDESKTMPRPWGVSERYYDNKSVEEYDTVIREFCGENGLEYIDMKGIIKIDDIEDGLHPNSRRHEKMFRAVLKTLNKFLRTWG